jgi:hypothetical protein
MNVLKPTKGAIEQNLDEWLAGLTSAIHAMAEAGWSPSDLDEAIHAAVASKTEAMMIAFRDRHISDLKAEGNINEAGLDHIRREADKIISRSLREIGDGMSSGRPWGTVLH